jgi:hypothetical protein
VEDEGGGDLERIFDKSLNTFAELITLVTLWNFLCLGEDFTGSASSSVSSVENRWLRREGIVALRFTDDLASRPGSCRELTGGTVISPVSFATNKELAGNRSARVDLPVPLFEPCSVKVCRLPSV